MIHPPGRLLSLDVFRGATIAAMILVNNAGDWGQTFSPLLHAPWHGWTVTDLVFPFFLFILGVAIPFAFASRLARSGGDRRALHGKIFRRALILLALGLFLSFFRLGPIPWERVRIPGVLQRIAVVYAFAALAYLHLKPRGRLVLSTLLLAAYWLAMVLIPVPGHGAGDLGPEGNLAAWIDHRVLGEHTWVYAPGPGDPEGLLTTLPALVSALAGLFVGEWLRSRHLQAGPDGPAGNEEIAGAGSPPPPPAALAPRHLWQLAGAGLLLLAAGLALHPFFPINKNLWSPSYVLFTAGFATVLLAGISWLVDGRGDRPPAWTLPFLVFGANSIAAFFASSFVARLLYLVGWSGPGGETVTLQQWLYGRFFEPLFPPYFASLAWALATLVLWLGLMALLYRKRVFIKV